jgi:hypothetical protein
MLTALIAMCACALMIQAGTAKKQLEWRPKRVNRERRRRP